MPCLYQWQNFQSGHYALGIEPSTHHVLGDQAARERGEMIWLEHDEGRRYDAVFRVLDGAAAIAAAEKKIRTVALQPEEVSTPLRPIPRARRQSRDRSGGQPVRDRHAVGALVGLIDERLR